MKILVFNQPAMSESSIAVYMITKTNISNTPALLFSSSLVKEGTLIDSQKTFFPIKYLLNDNNQMLTTSRMMGCTGDQIMEEEKSS
jgi:hypothetical protein